MSVFHGGSECVTREDKLRLLEGRASGYLACGTAEAKKLAAQALALRQEVMTMRVVAKDTKQCPSCQQHTTKIDGCNKMTCSLCGAYWCWKCCQPIEG
jgi:E3 ubiquitin-protein ligase RNF14